MAIVIHPRYPVPSRARRSIRFEKDEDGIIDVGWCEGVLADGRVFRGEMWAQDQVSVLTFFFSVDGLEELDAAGVRDIVERERLVTFPESGPTYCDAAVFVDDAERRLWSVNIVVGDDSATYITGSVPFFGYSRTEANTRFAAR